MNANWKPIEGSEYEVSDTGLVRRRRDGLVLKTTKMRDGHLMLGLRINGKRTTTTIHRLVMLAFVGERPVGLEVRHLDGNPENNNLSNLRYGTPKENAADRERHGRTARGDRNGGAKITEADADMIRLLYAARAASQQVIGAAFGISATQVSRICSLQKRKPIASQGRAA